MRHPLLRILVALLIGVASPLCCCQAMAMAGGVCGERHEVAAKADSCCQGCSGDPSSDQEQDAPEQEDPHTPGKCPSCPSCQGTSAGTGVKAEARLPAFEPQWDALSTLALAALWELPPTALQFKTVLPGWSHDPPFLRANRDALRWHCALLV